MPLCVVAAGPQSTVTQYSSAVTVLQNAGVSVVETIHIEVVGNELVAGLRKVMPFFTLINSPNKKPAKLVINKVELDSKDVKFDLEPKKYSSILTIYNPNEPIAPGKHIFTIHYHVPDQVKLHNGEGKLSWQISGFVEFFPIEKIRVNVKLPDKMGIVKIKPYIGATGGIPKPWFTANSSNSTVTFETHKTIQSSYQLAAEVYFDQGQMTAPEYHAAQDSQSFPIVDYYHTIILFLGFLILVYYYYGCMRQLIRSRPNKKAIFPRFKPPKGYSPAVLRYIKDIPLAFHFPVFQAA